jgi:hypothetical protein
MQQRHYTISLDAWVGLFFITIAVFFLGNGIGYDLGTMRRIGPGLFPILIAALLAIVGVASLVSGIRQGGESPKLVRLRILFPILAILVFAISIRPLGLLIASGLVVGISCRADTNWPRPVELLLAVGLAVCCYGVFALGLGMSLWLLPTL